MESEKKSISGQNVTDGSEYGAVFEEHRNNVSSEVGSNDTHPELVVNSVSDSSFEGFECFLCKLSDV